MNTMKWLIRREFWENKGMLFWAPICVGLFLILMIGSTAMYGITQHDLQGNFTVNGESTNANDMINHLTPENKASLATALSAGFMFASAPIMIIFSLIVFFYFLGALYEERRDRSILFWKSLPVSDQQTVLSKLLTALVVAPLIAIGVALITAYILLLLTCTALAFKGINVFGIVLSTPSLYLTPLQLVGLLPVYVLFALPTAGWLLLVSSWARSKVFLWAVVLPLLVVGTIAFAEHRSGLPLQSRWLFSEVVARGLAGLFPGVWLGLEHVQPQQLIDGTHHTASFSNVFVQSWGTLVGPNAWLGAAAGIGMIFGAIRIRRWREDA